MNETLLAGWTLYSHSNLKRNWFLWCDTVARTNTSRCNVMYAPIKLEGICNISMSCIRLLCDPMTKHFKWIKIAIFIQCLFNEFDDIIFLLKIHFFLIQHKTAFIQQIEICTHFIVRYFQSWKQFPNKKNDSYHIFIAYRLANTSEHATCSAFCVEFANATRNRFYRSVKCFFSILTDAI